MDQTNIDTALAKLNLSNSIKEGKCAEYA